MTHPRTRMTTANPDDHREPECRSAAGAQYQSSTWTDQRALSQPGVIAIW
jgi:hypothetical protein